MAVGAPDVYTYRASVSNAVTTANPHNYVVAATTIRSLVVGVREELGQTAAAAGNDCHFH